MYFMALVFKWFWFCKYNNLLQSHINRFQFVNSFTPRDIRTIINISKFSKYCLLNMKPKGSVNLCISSSTTRLFCDLRSL